MSVGFRDARAHTNETLTALNNMKEDLYREISLKNLLSSYFQTTLQSKVLVSFDRNLWAVAYTFSSLSYRFSGHEVDKTSKSGSRLAFLKRYLYPG